MTAPALTARADIATLLRRLRSYPRGFSLPRGDFGTITNQCTGAAFYPQPPAATPRAEAGARSVIGPPDAVGSVLTPAERQRVRAYIVAAMSRGELSPDSAEVFAGLLVEVG